MDYVCIYFNIHKLYSVVDVMTVTVNIVSIEGKRAIIECIDNNTKARIMRTPVVFKTKTKKGIEKAVSDAVKNFNSPVWGGFCVVFYCEVV